MGTGERKEFIMFHNYEVSNVIKKKSDGTLWEIITICYDFFDKERTGYIVCRRLNDNTREKLHVDEVEFMNVGNAKPYEFE